MANISLLLESATRYSVSGSPILYIGGYRILNIVYTGQTSQTWQAYDDHNRRPVAVKALFQSAVKDSEQVRFFKWEYNVGKDLEHPRIIRFYSFGKHGRAPFIAMEWFSAPNMKQQMLKGYENYCVWLNDFIPQMAEALVYFHEAGWVHCDVKPDNFLCSPEKGVKLIDFALARKIKGNFLAKLLHLKNKTQGTASYMSPEQIRGEQLDGRADIYSLGCSFFEMVSNRLLYTGGTMNELLQKHISGAIPSITARNRNVTPEFSELLNRMLAKKRKDRIQTMSDVYSTLRGIKIFKKLPQVGDKVY